MLSKKKIIARLNEHIVKDQGFCNNVLWADESKLFGHKNSRHVWRRPTTALLESILIPTVKFSGLTV